MKVIFPSDVRSLKAGREERNTIMSVCNEMKTRYNICIVNMYMHVRWVIRLPRLNIPKSFVKSEIKTFLHCNPDELPSCEWHFDLKQNSIRNHKIIILYIPTIFRSNISSRWYWVIKLIKWKPPTETIHTCPQEEDWQ